MLEKFGISKISIHMKQYTNKKELIGKRFLIRQSLPSEVTYLFIMPGNNTYYVDSRGTKGCIHRFDSKLQNTVFSGYMIDGVFYVEDCVVKNGKINKDPLCERLYYCNVTLDHMYVYDPVLSSNKIEMLEYVEPENIFFWNVGKSVELVSLDKPYVFRAGKISFSEK